MSTRHDAKPTDLGPILQGLAPELRDPDYVFCCLPEASYGAYARCKPLASIAEDEGLTLVLERDQADAEGLTYTGSFRCISLGAYSSLEAVGLTAAISATLTRAGISANLLAGFHHDHILIPAHRADEALKLLLQLSNDGQNPTASDG